MPWFDWIYRLQPCLLCGQNPAQSHRLCSLCWQELPWQQQIIHRHELHCQVCCRYQWPMDQMLQRFKDRAALHYLPVLQACLCSMAKPAVQAIVPMPISQQKLMQRGFNQSLLLAKGLAKTWQLPIWQPVSRHSGHSQRGLDRLDRLQNLETQFYLNQHKPRYRHVLMLDDVITTGASLAALKQQLQDLGCSHIHALCLCDAALA